MDLLLTNRVAFVAGSSRGIGKATATAFLAEGCRTVITGRDASALESTRAELAGRFDPDRVLAIEGDLTDPIAIDSALSKVNGLWGEVDCAVANIGTGRGQPGWEVGDDEWVRLLEANLSSATRFVQKVLARMMPRQRGSIVIVSSIAGIEATGAPLPYSAAKAALISYAKNIGRRVGPFGIRVNCVAPGNVLFPGGSWERHLASRHQEVMSLIRSEVPMQRFGTPEEIADVIVFLSSERAAFVTGSCVVADGGQTRGT